MNRKIFVIHSSAVIRKGLSAILRSFFYAEIISLDNLSGLGPHREIQDHILLFFVEEEALASGIPMARMKEQNRVMTVGVFLTSSPAIPAPCDSRMGIFEPADRFQQLVAEFFTNQKADTENHEGDELTVREKEVLQLVALGHANKSIAEKLFISTHTVISHRKNITDKLGIKSISGLTIYAILNKLINSETIDPQKLI